MNVRPARPSDAATILAIQGEAAREMRSIVTHPEEVRSVAAEEALLAQWGPTTGVMLVAEEGEVVLGFCAAARGRRRATAHTADLGLTVARAHRRRGVGRALMLGIEAWARAHGVHKLTLGVFATNAPARSLYAALGYVEEGLRREQYLLPSGPVDEVLMSKWVRP